MERHEACLALARRDLESARQTLDVTYRLLEEPKVLAVAAAKILSSMMSVVKAVLYHELVQKRIPIFDEEPQKMLHLFRARQERRYRFSEDYAGIIEDLRGLVLEHRKSPISFARRGNLVICTETYGCRILSCGLLQDRLEKAKIFIGEAENMVS